jgi:ABC-2 type transport system permease protein
MNKIWIVIKREYIQHVRTKGFVISTVLGPVLMIALMVVPILLAVGASGEKSALAVVDRSGEIQGDFAAKLSEFKMGDGSDRYALTSVAPAADPEAQKAELGRGIMAGTFTGYIFIPSDVLSGGVVEYASRHTSDLDQIKTLNQVLNGVVVGKRLKTEGLDPARIAEYTRPVRLDTVKVSEKGRERDSGGSFIVSYILVMILYMTMFFYGAMILRGVLEEKTNRVVEVVLSSLRPFQLMMGKILGIALVGLTQYTVWALFGFLMSKYGGSIAGALAPSARISGIAIASIPPYVFIYFVVFFILGYFLFATLYAAVGSAVNNEKEAQQMLMPVTMCLVVPILMMQYVMRSPNSSLSVILSLIPFFAPILMLQRISILMPPLIQVAGSIVILIVTTLGMVWLTGKIYRVGILMYGKKPSLPEILKWVRYK